MKLSPAFWRTCRAVACETRLQLLWHILEQGELSVSEGRMHVGISQPNASQQFRTLAERGLLIPRREGMRVIYRAEANDAVAFSANMLEALRECFDRKVSHKSVIRSATAFTHERRIEIVRALRGKSLSFNVLADVSGISPSALSRHLDKLERRGFVGRKTSEYCLRHPGDHFGQMLLKIVCSDGVIR